MNRSHVDSIGRLPLAPGATRAPFCVGGGEDLQRVHMPAVHLPLDWREGISDGDQT